MDMPQLQKIMAARLRDSVLLVMAVLFCSVISLYIESRAHKNGQLE